ncbi:hypothetical protein BGZ81_008550 [Podila clonocystis]|nr:hypothetical protein BGZ81_008550 [Podila clonocystis]
MVEEQGSVELLHQPSWHKTLAIHKEEQALAEERLAPRDYLEKKFSRSDASFRNSSWRPEAAEAMCKEVRHFQLPGGKDKKAITMGGLIDRIPKNSISMATLEEKLNPSGGAGAVMAIHDAVAVASWISTLKSTSLSDLETIFNDYRAERYPLAKDAFKLSQKFRNIGGKM